MATNLAVKKGQCINFGNCKNADTKKVLEIQLGNDFVCPDCRSHLVEIKEKPFPWIFVILAVGIVGIALIGFGLWKFGVFNLKPALEAIQLSPSTITLNSLGENQEITASSVPADTKMTLLWESSDPAVATVLSGKVTATGEGEAVVQAKSGKITASVTVIVKYPIVLKELRLLPEEFSLMVGESGDMFVSTVPADFNTENLEWKSSNTSIATVTAGNVVAIEAGEAFIEVEETDGLKATAFVKVVKKDDNNKTPLTALNFPYGTYTGDIKDGKAHGVGRLVYSKAQRISENDPKNRIAEPGDQISGIFEKNKPTTVKWYDKNGKLKESLIIGSTGF
jgi:hypothetical protein